MSSLKQKKSSNKKNAYIILFFGLCFWWLPFSLLKQDPPKALTEDELTHELSMHLADEYVLHFGNVTIPLPMIIYEKGVGWHCFSSARLAAHGDASVKYSGFMMEHGVLKQEHGAGFYDFSITKNVVMMLLGMLLLLLFFTGLANYLRRRKGRPPKGFWVLPLYLVRFIRNDIAREMIGPQDYKRFTPYLLTLFCYIFLQNILGLLPAAANLTGNIYITATLACFTLAVVTWNASLDYWAHIFIPPGVPIWLYPILVPIELMSLLLKYLLLAIRLCSNMLLGHIILLVMIGTIFFSKNLSFALGVIPLSAAFTLLKIFVSFVQAQVFTCLSAISIKKAIEKH